MRSPHQPCGAPGCATAPSGAPGGVKVESGGLVAGQVEQAERRGSVQHRITGVCRFGCRRTRARTPTIEWIVTRNQTEQGLVVRRQHMPLRSFGR